MRIIVEGPDGVGKTTLIDSLFSERALVPRHIHHNGDLAHGMTFEQWPLEQKKLWHKSPDTNLVYDRFPTISELAYMHLKDDMTPAEKMARRRYCWAFNTEALYSQTLVVFCLPEKIEDLILEGEQMAGVVDGIRDIVTNYMLLASHWKGPKIVTNPFNGRINLS